MHRSLLVIVLTAIAYSEGCRPPPCHWDDARLIEDYYTQVSDVMIEANKKLQDFCNRYGAPDIWEQHNDNEYALIYPDASYNIFEIKVKDRVLYVRGLSCFVVDVRVLPTYVEARGGYYRFESVGLVIIFPFKFNPNIGGGSCVPPDPSIIFLPNRTCNNDCNTTIGSKNGTISSTETPGAGNDTSTLLEDPESSTPTDGEPLPEPSDPLLLPDL